MDAEHSHTRALASLFIEVADTSAVFRVDQHFNLQE